MKSVDNKIEEKLKREKQGAILFVEDFLALGSTTAVHTALHRLVKTKKLARLARGIYAKPSFSKLLNKEVLPSAEEVAIAIAKRDKARIIPTGAYAQNALGLSTQVPLKLVYLTDGSPRTIKIGKRSIQFKKTTPKTLALKGKISKLVIQALKDIGKNNVTEQELIKIHSLLKQENKLNLKHDIALAPQWIAELMAKAL
jgi:hypothetical protein